MECNIFVSPVTYIFIFFLFSCFIKMLCENWVKKHEERVMTLVGDKNSKRFKKVVVLWGNIPLRGTTLLVALYLLCTEFSWKHGTLPWTCSVKNLVYVMVCSMDAILLYECAFTRMDRPLWFHHIITLMLSVPFLDSNMGLGQGDLSPEFVGAFELVTVGGGFAVFNCAAMIYYHVVPLNDFRSKTNAMFFCLVMKTVTIIFFFIGLVYFNIVNWHLMPNFGRWFGCFLLVFLTLNELYIWYVLYTIYRKKSNEYWLLQHTSRSFRRGSFDLTPVEVQEEEL